MLAVLAAVATTGWTNANAERAAAENAARTALARFLVAEGERLAVDDPVLGLRLATEGLAIGRDVSPPVDLLDDVRVLALRGRIAALGADVEAASGSWDGTTVVVDRANAPGEIIRVADGAIAATLGAELEWMEFTPVEYSTLNPMIPPVTFPPDRARTAPRDPSRTLTQVGLRSDGRAPLPRWERRTSPIGRSPARLPGKLAGFSASPTQLDDGFLAWYPNLPADIRNADGGQRVRLPFKVADARAVPGAAYWLVKRAEGGTGPDLG